MKITLSTTNQSKALQIKASFAGSRFTISTLSDEKIEGEAIEDGETLKDNALKKAVFAHRPGNWSMADDTGIFINALNGLPGVKSARWAGDVSTPEITAFTLEKLKGKTDRRATFRTVVALIDPEGKEYFFEGECPGTVLESPRVPPQPKMPYSGIFKPDASNKVWAEMTVDEENAISHRGIAFRKVQEFLEKL